MEESPRDKPTEEPTSFEFSSSFAAFEYLPKFLQGGKGGRGGKQNIAKKIDGACIHDAAMPFSAAVSVFYVLWSTFSTMRDGTVSLPLPLCLTKTKGEGG